MIVCACWPEIINALFGNPPAFTPSRMNGSPRKTIDKTAKVFGT